MDPKPDSVCPQRLKTDPKIALFAKTAGKIAKNSNSLNDRTQMTVMNGARVNFK